MAGREQQQQTGVPKISVVMPLYNRAGTIGAAVESVLAQTEGDFELIVVDDGSTDGSAEAVKAIGDPRVRLLRLGSNRGANAARNEGIRAARAPIVAFLDSDDLYLPHKLETVLATFAEHPDIEGVIDSYRSIKRPGRPDRDRRNPDLRDNREIARALFDRRIWKATPGISVRREAALRAGLFDEGLRRRQDYDFLLRLLRSARFVTIGTITWLKTYSPDAISRDFDRFMDDFTSFWDRHPQYYDDPDYRRGFAADLVNHLAKLVAAKRFDLFRRDIAIVQKRIGIRGLVRALFSGAAERRRLKRYRRSIGLS